MEIEIKPEDIDQYIKKAILDSTVGKSLVVNIEKSIKEMMSGWGSPVKTFMNEQLKKFVEEYMQQPEVKKICLEVITRTITPEVIEKIVNYGVVELYRRFNDNN